MLSIGQEAPDFTLPDSDMQKVSLSDFKGNKNVVLYFYPKDNSSSSTKEALDFTDLCEEFDNRNTVVLGVSKDNCMTHAEFRDKHGLSVQLLADTDGEVCERYGVCQDIDKDGTHSRGIVRSTFIIDRQGIVQYVQYRVKASGHAAEILQLIAKLP